MNRRLRRLIFWIFVLIFILATPPTILYSMGYSFDLQNFSLVQTGGLYFSSLPNDAEIALNGQETNKKTPVFLSHLLPRDYQITVGQNGFYPWQKTLRVEPKLVTEARNILLFPEKSSPERTAENVTTTIPYFLLSANERQNGQVAQKIASSNLGWLYQDGEIYYVATSSIMLYRADLSGSILEQISRDSLPLSNYRIITNDGRNFLLLADSGELYMLKRGESIFRKIAEQVVNAQMSYDNKKITWSSNSEIWVYWLADILIQPYHLADNKELITRFSQKISQVIFYPDNEHLAFVIGNQIKIIELDGRDRRNIIDFINTPDPEIYFDEKNGYFYYLTGEQLFRLKLPY